MAIRRVLMIQNEDDRKILKTRGREIKLPNSALRPLVADMFETMHAANGVGLAAPQIGLAQRIAVIHIPAPTEEQPDGTYIEVGEEQNYVLINPEIIKASDQILVAQEGCLSLPGWYGDVPRPAWVTVEFSDLDSKRTRLRRANGLLGRALQHEIDHLNGILFTERMTDLSTLKDLSKEDDPEG